MPSRRRRPVRWRRGARLAKSFKFLLPIWFLILQASLLIAKAKVRRVGKGALAPCPPSVIPDALFARTRNPGTESSSGFRVRGSGRVSRGPKPRPGMTVKELRGGGHVTGRVRVRRLCPPYAYHVDGCLDAITAPASTSA